MRDHCRFDWARRRAARRAMAVTAAIAALATGCGTTVPPHAAPALPVQPMPDLGPGRGVPAGMGPGTAPGTLRALSRIPLGSPVTITSPPHYSLHVRDTRRGRR